MFVFFLFTPLTLVSSPKPRMALGLLSARVFVLYPPLSDAGPRSRGKGLVTVSSCIGRRADEWRLLSALSSLGRCKGYKAVGVVLLNLDCIREDCGAA